MSPRSWLFAAMFALALAMAPFQTQVPAWAADSLVVRPVLESASNGDAPIPTLNVDDIEDLKEDLNTLASGNSPPVKSLQGRVRVEKGQASVYVLDVVELESPNALNDLSALRRRLEAETGQETALASLAMATPPKSRAQWRAEKTLFFLLLFANSTNSTNDNIGHRSVAAANLRKNLLNPFVRVAEGTKLDNNPFYVNYVAHPVDWFLLGTWLKSAGASDKEAIIVSQIANFLWEYVIEGSYIAPSGKDLLTDFVSSMAGIYLYNKGVTKPLGNLLTKAETFGRRHNVELKPHFGYNKNSRGGVVASKIIIYR